jgi:transposase
VTEHDVLVGFRLRLFTLAEELGNVSEACRVMGVDRSTYYRLKAKVDRWGLEALNVRERRRPRMPNQIGPHLEQRIVAFSLGHPAYGPRRISAELAREKWGGIRISEHGVWRVLCRVGLNTRTKRLALIARHRDPHERRPALAPPARHIDASAPGEKVQLDCFYLGRPSGTTGPSGNTPRSMSPRRSAGPSCTPPAQPPRQAHPRGAAPRPPSWPRPAGNSKR